MDYDTYAAMWYCPQGGHLCGKCCAKQTGRQRFVCSLHEREHLVPAGKLVQQLLRDLQFQPVRCSLGGWLPPNVTYPVFRTWVLQQLVCKKMALCKAAPFDVPEKSMTVADTLRIYTAYAETDSKPGIMSLGTELELPTTSGFRQLYCTPHAVLEVHVHLQHHRLGLKVLFFGPSKPQSQPVEVVVKISNVVVLRAVFELHTELELGTPLSPTAGTDAILGDIPDSVCAILACRTK